MRILIVEDSKEIGEFLTQSLSAESFAVDLVADGEKGSWMARTNAYDLIILDNILPKKNGPTICQEIRQAGKQVPILVLSVEADSPRKTELLNLGADDYLAKPFSWEELLARVRALLRRPQALAPDVLAIDDLVVDVQKQTVSRGKQDVYLTKKEFMLLEYLLRSRDTVVSRAAIMEHVWDMNADIFSNTIETHILTLRKKIDTHTKRKLIHTVPGRGYKLALVG